MTCTCGWERGFLARRDPACPEHGDGTPWWERVQARAVELGARIVGAP